VSRGSAVVIAEAKGEPILKTTPEDSRVLCSCLAALSTTWKYLPHVSVRGRGFSFNIISTPHRLSFTCPPAFPLHHSFRTSSPPRRARGGGAGLSRFHMSLGFLRSTKSRCHYGVRRRRYAQFDPSSRDEPLAPAGERSDTHSSSHTN
jgi:hypothetical protein